MHNIPRYLAILLITVVTTLTAGATGGIMSEIGSVPNEVTRLPNKGTDIINRAKFAAVNTASKTVADTAILNKSPGTALVDNLRGNLGTQVQSGLSNMIGDGRLSGDISQPEQLGLHAAAGVTGAAIKNTDPWSAMVSAPLSEAAAEAAFSAGFKPEAAADIGKIAGSTSGLLTNDVNSASESAITAIDNNFLPMAIGAVMLAEAYLISQIDEGKDIVDALEKVGRGDDTVSKLTEAAILSGVEISYEKYPSQTTAVLETLGEAAHAVGVAVTYVDEKTGKVVSSNWNDLSEKTQNRLKGGAGLIGVAVTGSAAGNAVKSVAGYSKLAKVIAPNEVANGVVKVGWKKGIMPQGMPWEDFVGTKLAEGTRLPAGFKTFDYFDESIGLATSAKTLDTMTPSKIAHPEQIYNTLKGYVDKTAGFEKGGVGENAITSAKIKTSRIELAIPSDTNAEQYKHIQKAIEYAHSQNIELNVTRLK